MICDYDYDYYDYQNVLIKTILSSHIATHMKVNEHNIVAICLYICCVILQLTNNKCNVVILCGALIISVAPFFG